MGLVGFVGVGGFFGDVGEGGELEGGFKEAHFGGLGVRGCVCGRMWLSDQDVMLLVMGFSGQKTC